MTADQKQIVEGLSKCRLSPGTWNKRFIKSLASIFTHNPEKELTESQNEWMYRMLYTYRKQLPNLYNKFKHIPVCSAVPKTTTIPTTA